MDYILLPVWCDKEVKHYIWLMNRWLTLTKTSCTYQFLIIRRFDYTGDTSALIKACSKYASTEEITLEEGGIGYPQGCNYMWYGGLQELKKRNARFGFWLEWDVIPLNPRWFDILEAQWTDDLLILGHLVTDKWLDNNGFARRKTWGEHINGAALYSPNIIPYVDEHVNLDREGWDVRIYEHIKEQTLGITDFYAMRLVPKTHLTPPNLKDNLLVHGLKDLESKNAYFNLLSIYY